MPTKSPTSVNHQCSGISPLHSRAAINRRPATSRKAPLQRQDKIPEEQGTGFYTRRSPCRPYLPEQIKRNGCLIYPDELSGLSASSSTTHKTAAVMNSGGCSPFTTGDRSRAPSPTSPATSASAVPFPCSPPFSRRSFWSALGDLNDDSGLWARFNLCEIPRQRRRLLAGAERSTTCCNPQRHATASAAWKSAVMGSLMTRQTCSAISTTSAKTRVDPDVKPALRAVP